MWPMFVWFNLDAVIEQSEVIDGGWILISAEDQSCLYRHFGSLLTCPDALTSYPCSSYYAVGVLLIRG